LRSIFSLWYDSVWFEDQQFTILHKIVLGAVDYDLEAQLKLTTSNINQQDSKGRTPIAWAAARGDEKCVKILLDFGADPEISCDTGNNPLLRSVRAKSPGCVRLLLQHGANVQARSALGFTALHYAAYYQDDEAHLKMLLDFGAQIDEKDGYGWTPLSCTAEYDHMRSASILLECGASPDLPDKSGWSPIMRAIRSNSHRVLRLLLDKGADYSSLSFRLQTVLHFAAAYGDVDTIVLLTDIKMRKITTNMKDVNGHTAAEIFLSRGSSSCDLVNAFTNLLNSMDDVSPCESLP
jgi:ankyrin repeat protein